MPSDGLNHQEIYHISVLNFVSLRLSLLSKEFSLEEILYMLSKQRGKIL